MATVVTFLVVIVGWIFSLCLHEFSHALVAYYGGDTSVRDKGYLTFNPLEVYASGLFDPAADDLPAAGRDRPAGRGGLYRDLAPAQQTLGECRLAGRAGCQPGAGGGPVDRFAFCAVCSRRHLAGTGLPGTAAGHGGGFEPDPGAAVRRVPGGGALPGLQNLRVRIDQASDIIMLAVFFLLWYVPFVNNFFWTTVGWISVQLQIPLQLASLGLSQFQFWNHERHSAYWIVHLDTPSLTLSLPEGSGNSLPFGEGPGMRERNGPKAMDRAAS